MLGVETTRGCVLLDTGTQVRDLTGRRKGHSSTSLWPGTPPRCTFVPMNALAPKPLPLSSPARSLKGWQPWYDTIIDWFLTHPGGKIIECAKDLRKTPQWIGQLIRNDFFRARLAQRRDEFNRDLGSAVDQRLSEVALKSLDLLLEKMDTNRHTMKPGEVLSIADKALTALGYGAAAQAAGGGTPVQVNISVSPEALARARNSLRSVERTRIEATAREVDTRPGFDTEDRTVASLPADADPEGE